MQGRAADAKRLRGERNIALRARQSAAKGCPPLRNEAFVASRLDAQLEEQTRRFLNDARYTKLDGTTLTLSKIFDWYGTDFGDLPDFVRKYRKLPDGGEVRFMDYDWSLNKA